MTRLGDFGRDAAYYFGVGEGSDRVRQRDGAEPAPWASVAVGVVPVVVAALLLRRVLGLSDGFFGFVAFLGVVVVLATAWGITLRSVRDRRGAQSPRSED